MIASHPGSAYPYDRSDDWERVPVSMQRQTYVEVCEAPLPTIAEWRHTIDEQLAFQNINRAALNEHEYPPGEDMLGRNEQKHKRRKSRKRRKQLQNRDFQREFEEMS